MNMRKKSKFDWKVFLKPNWEKFLVFLGVIFIISLFMTIMTFYILRDYSLAPDFYYISNTLDVILTPASEIYVTISFYYMNNRIPTPTYVYFLGDILSMLDLIYHYIIACALVWIYHNKIKKGIKRK